VADSPFVSQPINYGDIGLSENERHQWQEHYLCMVAEYLFKLTKKKKHKNKKK
jgi:hypothetical protein